MDCEILGDLITIIRCDYSPLVPIMAFVFYGMVVYRVALVDLKSGWVKVLQDIIFAVLLSAFIAVFSTVMLVIAHEFIRSVLAPIVAILLGFPAYFWFILVFALLAGLVLGVVRRMG